MAETMGERVVQGRDKATVRRSKIVSAARRLFIENGFHATGVAQIAKESGIAVGQIYRDFSSKEAIVAEIVHADCIEFLSPESLRRGIESGNPEFVWTWLADFVRPEAGESDPLFAEIVAEAARNPRVAAIFDVIRDDIEGTMLAALAALVPGESFAERRAALADLIIATAMGLMQHRLLHDGSGSGRATALALKMIRAEVAAMQAEGEGA